MPPLPGLRRQREFAALTQRELSERTGLAISTIIDLELGKSSARASTVRRLAEALRCEPRDLLVS